MKELVVDFNQQGKTLIFSLTLWIEEELKKQFPKANPLKVMLRIRDNQYSVSENKTSILKYVIPMLTGLEPEDIKKIPEISVINRPEKTKYVTIKTADVEEK